jgi:CRP/FNR family transcriptional regulator, cyclic AMP receptor protein
MAYVPRGVRVTEGVQERYVELLRSCGDSETFQEGEAIFHEGDLADRMYLVDNGSVSLKVGEHVVETVGPGGLFGEIAVIDREPRSASAVAASDCALITIDKRRFWFLVQETPYFAEIVMRVMASRIRTMNNTLT